MLTLSFVDGCRGEIQEDVLAVSHVWESPAEPDVDGVQLAAIRRHLLEHRGIAYVWLDYWCMPQGRERSMAEEVMPTARVA